MAERLLGVVLSDEPVARPIAPRQSFLPAGTHHYTLRLHRFGALVPARLVWLDHEPGQPDNRLDRGRLSRFPQVDIAGEIVDPEILEERLMAPRRHWKWPEPVTEAEYRYRLDHLRWVERNQPDHPTLRPRRRVNYLTAPLPKFAAKMQMPAGSPQPAPCKGEADAQTSEAPTADCGDLDPLGQGHPIGSGGRVETITSALLPAGRAR